MTWINLTDDRSIGKSKLPLNSLTYRTISHTRKNGKKWQKVEIIIPKSVAVKAGIEIQTVVNVFYDPEKHFFRISLTKDKDGIIVKKLYHKIKTVRHVVIRFAIPIITEIPLTENKNFYIHVWDFNGGLVFPAPVITEPDNKEENDRA